jgi:hypothetical protein
LGKCNSIKYWGKRYSSGSNISVPANATVTVTLPFIPSIIYLDGDASNKIIYFSPLGKTYYYNMQGSIFIITPISNGFTIKSQGPTITFTYYAWE